MPETLARGDVYFSEKEKQALIIKACIEQNKAVPFELRKEVSFQRDDSLASQLFAKVCRIALDAGQLAFRTFFANHHPPESLAAFLASPEVHKALRRLRIRGVISEPQWRLLYPQDKAQVRADRFDLSLLLVLAKYACQLRRPYPAGWNGPPLDGDSSAGAHLVRFQLLRRRLAALEGLVEAEYRELVAELRRLLAAFGGDSVKRAIHALRRAAMPPEEQAGAFAAFAAWHAREEAVWDQEVALLSARQHRSADIPALQRRIQPRERAYDTASAPPRKISSNRLLPALGPTNSTNSFGSLPPVHANNRWSDIKTGMDTEEKVILEKFYARIVAEVKPDALIDHLTSRRLLTMEESNEVFSTLKSTEQMAILIECLVPKSGPVFQELLNSLKGRYNALHADIAAEYERVVNDILSTKPEGAPYCTELLIERYLTALSTWTPIPWYREVEVNFIDFYCQLQLMDVAGKNISPFDIFAPNKSGKVPRWVVIEGEPGTGKSTLAKYISHHWATNQNVFTGFPIKMLFYIDLKIMAPNVKVMMIEQLFGGTFKLTERELWDVIEDNQNACLFVLDGYEENVNDDVQGILMGNSIPQSHVLVFSHSNFTAKLQDFFDRKFILTGFARGKPEEFVQKYVQVTNKPKELFAGLIAKLSGIASTRRESCVPAPSQRPVSQGVLLETAGSPPGSASKDGNTPEGRRELSRRPSSLMIQLEEASPAAKQTVPNKQLTPIERVSALRFYSQVPLYCSFFCVMTDLKLSIDLTSWTAMLEHFLTAIKMKLIERDRESRFNVNKSYVQLNELALDTMKNGLCTVFVDDCEHDPLVRFGLLREAINLTTNENKRFYFPNRLLQEYLAAKCLDMVGYDEAARFFQTCTLNRHMHNVAVFYCGLRKNDVETQALRTLMAKVLEINVRQNRVNAREDEERRQGKECKARRVEGKIMEYQLSLECMALMDGRVDLGQNVVKTLPERIVVKNRGIIPILTLQGLSYLIQMDTEKMKEVDIRLDHLSRQTPEALFKLADAVRKSARIETLRVFWQQKEIMSDFLAIVCDANESLRKISCVDESRGTCDRITGKTWTDLRRACQNMTHVECFVFRQCRHMSLVNAIIRNLPSTLTKLDLSGCDINIITSQDLATKLANSKSIDSLIMGGVRIDCMAFNTFIKALCTNRSIKRLCLKQVKLDNVCFFALSEALKMNNRLEELDLRHVAINSRSCDELSQVMKINSTLKTIKLTAERIDAEGRHLMQQHAKPHLRLEGLPPPLPVRKMRKVDQQQPQRPGTSGEDFRFS